MNVEQVLKSYVEAALWSSTDQDENLDQNYTYDDLDQETLDKMREDVSKFVRENESDLLTWKGENGNNTTPEEQAGHDFWLTRNRHGAGFWESEWGNRGENLTKAAQNFGECWLYVTDDNKVSLG